MFNKCSNITDDMNQEDIAIMHERWKEKDKTWALRSVLSC